MEVPTLPTLRAVLAKASHANSVLAQGHASDTENLRASALAKISEFRELGYPLDVLKKACTFLAATSGERTWLTVRYALR